ncbi:hypothetical protein B0J18DRAFT_193764 [Chaetomium sp. MPI-SDFR-AT-0129]|nr:hypothetical protein B0J18DRAFT_193764 [Chaetomium sp. MPI-SDFR-AT-0129]
MPRNQGQFLAASAELCGGCDESRSDLVRDWGIEMQVPRNNLAWSAFPAELAGFPMVKQARRGRLRGPTRPFVIIVASRFVSARSKNSKEPTGFLCVFSPKLFFFFPELWPPIESHIVPCGSEDRFSPRLENQQNGTFLQSVRQPVDFMCTTSANPTSVSASRRAWSAFVFFKPSFNSQRSLPVPGAPPVRSAGPGESAIPTSAGI